MKEVFVSEIFKSFQGEGPQVGKPTLFVRFFACNLNCGFCDSKYSNTIKDAKEKGIEVKKFTFNELNDTIYKMMESDLNMNICFTGGEPMLQLDFLRQFQTSTKFGGIVEIETNGTINMKYMPNTFHLNISPKLTNSINDVTTEYFAKLVKNIVDISKTDRQICLKFVVATDDSFERDILEVQTFLNYINVNHQYWKKEIPIFLMPMGTDVKTIIGGIHRLSFESEFIKFPFTISPRLHVLVYGNKIGV